MALDNKSICYDQGGIKTIDVIKAKLTPEQFEGYLLGNIIKYTCRLNWKGSAERDVEKIGNYAKQLVVCNAITKVVTKTEGSKICDICYSYDCHVDDCPNNTNINHPFV